MNINENSSDQPKEETLDKTKFTEAEQKAMESGWRPLEEWDGDPDDWVDAKEFNLRGELMGRIQKQTHELRHQGTELQQLKAALRELGEHNKRIAKAEYEKALRELKSQKAQAFENQDYEQAVEIDDKIYELKESGEKDFSDPQQEEANTPNPQDITQHPEVQSWMQRNSWYGQNKALTGAADRIGMELLQSNPQYQENPAEFLEALDKQLVEELPEKFGKEKPTRNSPNPVTASGDPNARSTNRRTKSLVGKLTEEQKRIGTTFVKSGAFENLEEYAKQLADLGDI